MCMHAYVFPGEIYIKYVIYLYIGNKMLFFFLSFSFFSQETWPEESKRCLQTKCLSRYFVVVHDAFISTLG